MDNFIIDLIYFGIVKYHSCLYQKCISYNICHNSRRYSLIYTKMQIIKSKCFSKDFFDYGDGEKESLYTQIKSESLFCHYDVVCDMKNVWWVFVVLE